VVADLVGEQPRASLEVQMRLAGVEPEEHPDGSAVQRPHIRLGEHVGVHCPATATAVRLKPGSHPWVVRRDRRPAGEESTDRLIPVGGQLRAGRHGSLTVAGHRAFRYRKLV
jgi:hypothetical protein